MGATVAFCDRVASVIGQYNWSRRLRRKVRLGSKTEVAVLRRDVCFAPVSGHRQLGGARPLCAMKRLMHRSNLTGYSMTSSARANTVAGW